MARSLEQSLFEAFRNDDEDLALRLIADGADPAAVDDMEWTPAHVASAKGFRRALEALLERGADPDARDAYGNAPLHLAAGHAEPECARALLDGGADPDALNGSGMPPLAAACDMPQDYRSGGDPPWWRQEESILALALACSPNLASRGGETPLHIVCGAEEVSLKACRALLDRGADPNARDEEGSAPLHLAALDESAECCRMLLDAGAELIPVKATGMSPLGLARSQGYAETAAFLQSAIEKRALQEEIARAERTSAKPPAQPKARPGRSL